VKNQSIRELVNTASGKLLLFLPHAVRQMSRPERMVTKNEVRYIIENGEIIEDYPEDVRGHSCLIFGYGNNNRPIHVVVSPKEDYLAIITVYIPNTENWENNYKKRKRK
jgi:hypothetical protein